MKLFMAGVKMIEDEDEEGRRRGGPIK